MGNIMSYAAASIPYGSGATGVQGALSDIAIGSAHINRVIDCDMKIDGNESVNDLLGRFTDKELAAKIRILVTEADDSTLIYKNSIIGISCQKDAWNYVKACVDVHSYTGDLFNFFRETDILMGIASLVTSYKSELLCCIDVDLITSSEMTIVLACAKCKNSPKPEDIPKLFKCDVRNMATNIALRSGASVDMILSSPIVDDTEPLDATKLIDVAFNLGKMTKLYD